MNAIITAATGYTETDLQIFLWSIAKSCADTKVFLIAYKRDRLAIERLRDKYPFVIPVYIGASIRAQVARLAHQRTRPYCTWLAERLSKREYSSIGFPLEALGRLALRIAQERFFIARQLLRTYRDSFANFLLTDSRDVVIQSDPFRLLDGNLVSGLEPETIGEERYTASWIEDIYGKDILHKMFDSPTVCSGVTLGPAKEVENYLSLMCSEMWGLLPRIVFAAGCDQGFHDYLIVEKQITPELTNNQQGLIATVGLENPDNLSIDFKSGLVKVWDKYPAIIHQYDRHPHLLSFFKDLTTEAIALPQSSVNLSVGERVRTKF